MYIKIKCTYTNVVDATLWATTRACSVRLIILVKNLIIIKKSIRIPMIRKTVLKIHI